MTAGKSKKRPKGKLAMKVSLSELENTSGKFRMASRDTIAIIDDLDKTMKKLEETWDDANQETFFKYFSEWHTHTLGVSELLNLAANELDAIAERYYKADSSELPTSE